MISNLIKLNKNLFNCSTDEKQSLAALLSFPEEISAELCEDIFCYNPNIIGGLTVTDTGFIIGGYICELYDAYGIIYLKKIVINPKLKSSKYARDLIFHIGDRGQEIFGKNFKGIVATSFCSKKEKIRNEKHRMITKALFNAGGKLVYECAKLQNKFLHFIYIPYGGGREIDEVKELFRKIFK